MTPVENLRVGHYVAIVADKRPPEDSPLNGPYGRRANNDLSFSGQPFEILAISLPFLAVTDGQSVTSIDVRDFDVQKMTRKYVDAWLLARITQGTACQPNGCSVIQKPHPRDCPQCGDRMVQRRSYPKGRLSAIVVLACKRCGFERPDSGILMRND